MDEVRVILAATGSSLARAEKFAGEWTVSHQFEGQKINCMIQDPKNSQKVLIGTQNQGVLSSLDAGITWSELGLKGTPVKSMAIDPNDTQVIYAGCKPVSLYQSRDSGNNWNELDAMRKTKQFWWFSPADPPGTAPYVNGLAVSPHNPDVLLAGIEVGATMRSEDRGTTWSKHLPGSQRDCHSLKFHPYDGNWAYQGGGGGVSFSRDGGRTWYKPKEGLGSKYGWMVAADPEQPNIWYLTASEMPNLLRGEFDPPAHHDGNARAHIFRTKNGSPWVQLNGGLPKTLDYMAYDLATVPDSPGHIYAGLANGDVWFSNDYGDSWNQLPVNLGGIHASMLVL